MAAAKTTYTLNNGTTIPALGFGTWQAAPGAVATAVKEAVTAGFRHIDCAKVYQNEKEIGGAFAEIFAAGAVKRTDLFITSKLWNTDHCPKHVEATCRQTLSDLGLEYLDLYLVHWPTAWAHPANGDFSSPAAFFPPSKTYKNGRDCLAMTNDAAEDANETPSLLATWRAMEGLVAKGLVKSIGVSNYSAAEVDALCAAASIKPVVNQVELHMRVPQTELKAACGKYDIRLEAYCPLAIGMGDAQTTGLIHDEDVIAIAKAADLTGPAELCLRWALQQGVVVLTKSVTPARIQAAVSLPHEGQLTAAVMAEVASKVTAKGVERICDPPMLTATGDRPFFPANSGA